jgi:hypothetical protein
VIIFRIRSLSLLFSSINRASAPLEHYVCLCAGRLPPGETSVYYQSANGRYNTLKNKLCTIGVTSLDFISPWLELRDNHLPLKFPVAGSPSPTTSIASGNLIYFRASANRIYAEGAVVLIFHRSALRMIWVSALSSGESATLLHQR